MKRKKGKFIKIKGRKLRKRGHYFTLICFISSPLLTMKGTRVCVSLFHTFMNLECFWGHSLSQLQMGGVTSSLGALFEHWGVWYFAQRHFGSALKMSFHLHLVIIYRTYSGTMRMKAPSSLFLLPCSPLCTSYLLTLSMSAPLCN